VEPCPRCGFTVGVWVFPGPSAQMRGWCCALCRTRWWIGAVVTPVTPRLFLDLAHCGRGVGAMRAVLADLVALADEAPVLSDERLRARRVGLVRGLGGEIR
jgi:hypothetical protein